MASVAFVDDTDVDPAHLVLTVHATDASLTDAAAQEEQPQDNDEPVTLTIEGIGDEPEPAADATTDSAPFVDGLLQRIEQDMAVRADDPPTPDDEGVHKDDERLVAIVRLHEAVAVGNVDAAVELIRTGHTARTADANTTIPEDPLKLTPLMRACGSVQANQSMVYMLLQHGADVNALDTRGHSALMWACESKHNALARILIEHGARVDIFSSDGASALLLACENGDIRLVRYLLVTAKAPVNDISPSNLTPFMLAVARNNALLAALLIEHGADVNLGANKQWPLSIACEHDDIIMAAYLLDKGAQINRPIEPLQNISCLFQACDRGNLGLVKLLLMRGIHVNHVDNNGRSALSYLCENEGFQHLKKETISTLIAVLLEHGADPLLADTSGSTPVSYARIHPDPAILEQLLNWIRQSRRR